MAVASLIVAVVALLVSTAVAVLQYRQSGRLARLEEDRRTDELRPTLRTTYDESTNPPKVLITNDGPFSYTDVTIEVVRRPDVVDHIVFLDQAGDHGRTGPIDFGGIATLRAVQRETGEGGELRLRATCVTADGRTWTVLTSCEVPPRHGPMVSFA